jgi:hypothetical protein
MENGEEPIQISPFAVPNSYLGGLGYTSQLVPLRLGDGTGGRLDAWSVGRPHNDYSEKAKR